MYKLLLCQRYLRTRFIALASIISVTLGVATMIVVNSVMTGFQEEMYQRMHGILSDVVFESYGLTGFQDPEGHMEEIRSVVGDDIEGMTATVSIPAMLSFEYNGRWIPRHVNLIGIDKESYAEVGDFKEFVTHPANREKLEFILREGGYDPRLKACGWEYRRQEALYKEALKREQEAIERADQVASGPVAEPPLPNPSQLEAPEASAPTEPPMAAPLVAPGLAADPFSTRRDPIQPEDIFDPGKDQHTGIILGFSIASVRHDVVDPETGETSTEDFFLCRPGDDVKITMPTASMPPKIVNGTFTCVDLYESKMSEYDSTFVFMPLEKLQQMRGMVDPQTGMTSVTAIQIKLKEGADLVAVRDKLRARFPMATFPYRIQTWKDMQGPLLQAVAMETMILNILLFLIIGVAGFGILATFFMIVVEKTRDIGVLKAIGAPSRGVLSIFLGYGLSLGAVGAGAGMVLGLLFVVNINRIADLIGYVTGQEVFNEKIYYFSKIPTIIDPFTVGWIVCGALGIAVLASVLPALRAARLHPVEALRYE